MHRLKLEIEKEQILNGHNGYTPSPSQAYTCHILNENWIHYSSYHLSKASIPMTLVVTTSKKVPHQIKQPTNQKQTNKTTRENEWMH